MNSIFSKSNESREKRITNYADTIRSKIKPSNDTTHSYPFLNIKEDKIEVALKGGAETVLKDRIEAALEELTLPIDIPIFYLSQDNNELFLGNTLIGSFGQQTGAKTEPVITPRKAKFLPASFCNAGD